MFPPHTRGWTRRSLHRPKTHTVSPAHAGMDLSLMCGVAVILRFPRTRGDGPTGNPPLIVVSMFPPHTRGWTHAWLDAYLLATVSPAHAGMDL